jgi:hypothetical protein
VKRILVIAALAASFAASTVAYVCVVHVPMTAIDEPGLVRLGSLLVAHPATWIPRLGLHGEWIRWPGYALVAAQAAALGGNVIGWRLTSLILHLINCLLVFAFIRALVGRVAPAAMGAALFAVWPAGFLAVAWVPAQFDLSFATVMLVTLWAWAEWRLRNRAWAYPVCLGAFCVTLMSKETAVVLLGCLLLAEYLIAARPRRWVQLAPFACAEVLYLAYAAIHFLGTTCATPALSRWPNLLANVGHSFGFGISFLSLALVVGVLAMMIRAPRRLSLWAVASVTLVAAPPAFAAWFGGMASWYLYAPSVFAVIAIAAGFDARLIPVVLMVWMLAFAQLSVNLSDWHRQQSMVSPSAGPETLRFLSHRQFDRPSAVFDAALRFFLKHPASQKRVAGAKR